MSESKQTKKVIGEALVAFCEEKSFKKISVQDLTKKVGLNRQTFYYHFSDKYDLLRWVYLEDSLCYLKSESLSLENWEEQALKMLKAMKEKGPFYHNTVREDPEILVNEFSEITQKLFISLFNQMDEEKQLSEKDKYFYARFFSYGCSGVLINWILESYEESPLEIATQLFRLAQDVEFFSYQLYSKNEVE
ncbi:TetR family transcriptional regulator [Enterococcus sp. JM4C]|uniref:TetR/AcrR family transcriptional regulator n=1 Tax=Candidatus Enterococcus huntleyi TaxID=1857217 RepID=UPI00137AD71E|nr:TetR/AcrR family transcriptional regulator [Enterococcus sp. JM4C]KAF1299120.1 TetR family transcriptional regulator [Enterococcus sp. JM4C]